MMKLANGYRTSEPTTHAKRTPKSSPIRECVPNMIVLNAPTTAWISSCRTTHVEGVTYSDVKATHIPNKRIAALNPADKTPFQRWKSPRKLRTVNSTASQEPWPCSRTEIPTPPSQPNSASRKRRTTRVRKHWRLWRILYLEPGSC